MTVDLSVIIPCHNVGETLHAQLDALRQQQWTGSWDVIIVDNNSTDATGAVAEQFVELDRRFRVVRANSGRGASYARRVGVEHSSATAFAFCDGDDVVGPGWVRAIGDALGVHTVVTGHVDASLLNPESLRASRGANQRIGPMRYGEVPHLSSGNCGIQRQTWDAVGGFDEDFRGLEDIELSLRLASAGVAVHFEPNAVVHYRYRSTLRGLWHQGRFYGSSYPQLDRIGRRLGLPMPPRFRGLRSWAWLIIHLPLAPLRSHRARWVWTLACRTGALQAGITATIRRSS